MLVANGYGIDEVAAPLLLAFAAFRCVREYSSPRQPVEAVEARVSSAMVGWSWLRFYCCLRSLLSGFRSGLHGPIHWLRVAAV